ncbi:hypothetical protein M9Y90_19055 [Leptospira interrogans]|uniref:Uncharacterized protein n=1 Tax=Leptospira interrogans serovar Bataviae TaxID=312175 RepID=A0AAP9WP37_LEPIR|nr:hypothetical protein [Leptospira interrogans]MCL8312736.1 hypothetical protein [Leptospira interrogans]QOI52981.1 hypothetical protein Lepto1489_21570 [Leptospira interrogans serovar Bataviae]
MKLRTLNILILSLGLFMNCFIGSHRDACRYNLKQRDVFEASPDSCDFLTYTTLFTQKDNETLEQYEARKNAAFNFSLIKCLDYYEKLKECDKEEYKYMPAIYGYNIELFSNKKSSVIALR